MYKNQKLFIFENQILVSEKGKDGLPGVDGKSFNPKGKLADEATIKAVVNPAKDDAHIAADTGD